MESKERGTRRKRPLAATVELVQDISAISHPLEGFLRRHRHRARTRLDDGTRTDVYVADFVDRDPRIRDAVAVAAFSRAAADRDLESTRVLLRRQVRYAAYVITGQPLVTEVVAGLIEAPEAPEETARRELAEEAGIDVAIECLRPLGHPFFVLPGTFTERIFPIAAEIAEDVLTLAPEKTPDGDGSPMEQAAETVVITLGEALAMIEADDGRETGRIGDAKTEIVLRRLFQALREGKL